MMKQRKLWDTSLFSQVNLPEVIKRVDPAYADFKKIRVLDLPLYMPGQGWEIPRDLVQFRDIIRAVMINESDYGRYNGHYVYITVDQKVVPYGKTGRRAGAHSDAYIESKGAQIDITTEYSDVIDAQVGDVSHTYIVYDALPTEFFDVPFPLSDTSDTGSLKTFNEIADSVVDPVTYPAHTLLKLDPYVVHRCSVNRTGETERTFVKVSVSRERYARIGNTINPKFEYDWEMKARSPSERNTPW